MWNNENEFKLIFIKIIFCYVHFFCLVLISEIFLNMKFKLSWVYVIFMIYNFILVRVS